MASRVPLFGNWDAPPAYEFTRVFSRSARTDNANQVEEVDSARPRDEGNELFPAIGPSDQVKRSTSAKEPKKPSGGRFGRRIYWKFWKWGTQNDNVTLSEDNDEPCNLTIERELVNINHTRARKFTYKALAEATKNFNPRTVVGRGGFGRVYKGLLNGLNMPVAIKKMDKPTSEGKQEFLSEIKILVQLQHENLVPMVGWCHERELMLVYEFMPKGNLSSHLYRTAEGKKQALDWKTRYGVILGLASALLYLHEEWKMCVLHRDLKPGNIMLDSDMKPKLSDFGLARLMDHNGLELTTDVAGTIGYMAPEYINGGKFGKKSDVYSFGIIALEVACGKRPFQGNDGADDGQHKALVEKVWDLYVKGAVLEAADERLHGSFDKVQMMQVIVVGLWCTLPDIESRPFISLAKRVLSFEDPLPNLAILMPSPNYPKTPKMSMPSFSASTTFVYTHVSTRIFRKAAPASKPTASDTSSTSKAPNPPRINYLSPISSVAYDSQESSQSTRRDHLASVLSEDVCGNDHPEASHKDEVGGNFVVQQGSNFDIGIPPGYSSPALMQLSYHIPIFEGLVRSLDEIVKAEPEFNMVLELFKKSTSFLVSLGAPLEQWNSLAQYLLQTIKDIEGMKLQLESGWGDVDLTSKKLSTLNKEMDACSSIIDADNAKLKTSRQNLENSQEAHILLKAELAELQKKLETLQKKIKDAEDGCLLIKKSINVVETKRDQNLEKLESLKAAAATTVGELQVRKAELQDLEQSMSALRNSMSSKLSSFLSRGT